MLVMKCLEGLTVIVAVCVGLYAFNAHNGRNFGHRFFTVSGLVVSALSIGLVVVGRNWYVDAAQHHDDILNGVLLIAIGIIVGASLVYTNIRRTSPLVGTTGSLVQFGLSPLLAIPVATVWVIALFHTDDD